VERICQNLVILKNGLVVFEGATDQLLNNVNQGTDIIFEASGQRDSVIVADLREAQTAIDRLRADGANIVEVRQLRPTLEEAFVKVALHGQERV
jgi:ABC-type multidrug transport system ATPase subunit